MKQVSVKISVQCGLPRMSLSEDHTCMCLMNSVCHMISNMVVDLVYRNKVNKFCHSKA